jgi:ribonuclease HI
MWASELSHHIVDFQKRSAIKSQVLVDFIADWTEPLSYTKSTVIDTPWKLYCDGAGAAAVLMSPLGIKLRYAARLQFIAEIDKCSNNIAEYKVVLLGLRKLQAMGVEYCTLKIDSIVIASQKEKECMARDETLERYLSVVRRMENHFKGFTVEHIERTKNT